MAYLGGTLDEAYKRFKLPLIPFSLVTTANGNAAGTTIISAQLIGVAAVVMNSCAIIITAGDYLGFKAPVMAFDNTTGTLTLGDPMGAAIVAGTRFAVVPAEAVSVDIALDDTLVFVGVCGAGMAGSTTTIVCPDMVGKWADDFFNTDWLAIVLLDVDDPGDAPEGERRDITNYVSATGTFTTQAFSGIVEAGDVIMFVRREVVAGIIAQGMFYLGRCNVGMTGSTTAIVSADLAGFEDDFFNTDYVMVIILDVNDVGDAPEGEVRDITNYVGATGTFATVAFTANVEESDVILVARREYFVVDGVALKATPIANSLASRISQFIASGDGDFAGSTILPSNISLFDIISRTGDPAFPIAERPANNVSLVEVLRWLAEHTGQGLVFTGICDAGMTGSPTEMVSDDLKGFGNDYFNTDYVMVVLLDANDVGDAPEGEARDITNYVSNTGVFTTVAFSGNVEEADVIMIVRRELLVVDAVPLKTTPITDSFAYKVAQFIAGGDGDFATATPLPADTSLYDTLGTPTVWTATASAVGTITDANLINQAGLYVGEIVVPLSGNMAGQGRYITAYDGTGVLTVLPAWPVAPGNVDFVIIPSEAGRLLLALGAEYDGSPDMYDTIVTGYVTAVVAVVQGSVLERLELLQDVGITGNAIYTATASAVGELTCADLPDGVGYFVGQMVVPITGIMAGQGRYITAYDAVDQITVLPVWPADPGATVKFVIVPSEISRLLLALGSEFDGSPDVYDAIITGWTGAATATAVGSLIERLQLLQQALINANTIFTSTAATVNTVTCASLVDRADLYEGMMLVPMDGNQAGQGRYITDYDDTGILTVVPDWSTDPDAAGAFTFVIMPSPVKFTYEAGKGLSAIYDLVNGLPVMTRVYNEVDIGVLTVEETVFEYDDAAYVWHPHWLEFHLDELAAAEQLEVKIYVKDNDTDNNERLMMHLDYLGVQAVPVKFVELPPVDLYFKVTVKQTGGALRDVLFKLYKES